MEQRAPAGEQAPPAALAPDAAVAPDIPSGDGAGGPGRAITIPLTVIAIVSGGAALFFARDLVLPIAVAVLLALTLSPVVRWLQRRRVPSALSAFVMVALIVAATLAAVYGLSGSVAEWRERLPSAGEQFRKHWQAIRAPVDDVLEASRKIQELTEEGSGKVQRVTIEQPALLASAASNLLSGLTSAVVTLILTFFMLASGRLFYNKLVRVMPSLADKKRALTVVYAVEEELSAYLFMITLINSLLGLAIGVGMWAIGLPNPVLWGVMAALLNFIPYAGALIGAAIVATVGLLASDQPAIALAAGALYLALSAIEGNLVTPWLVGRRLALNAVVILIAVGLWTWLWGPVGAVIAVPMLACLRVICAHSGSLASLGEFLSDSGGLQGTDHDDS